MNKTLWHYRHLAFRWHSWPVQFCNSIKITSPNPLVSQHCLHMPEPCVRITASNLSPKQCLYCFITVQWVKFKITCSCLLLWSVWVTHGHKYCPPGLKSFTYWSGKKDCEHFFVWTNLLSARSKEGDVNRSVPLEKGCESPMPCNSNGLNVKHVSPTHESKDKPQHARKLVKADKGLEKKRHLQELLYVF